MPTRPTRGSGFCRSGLHLDDAAVLNQKVHSVANVDRMTVMDDRDRNLGLLLDARLPQYMREASTIGALEEAWVKVRMYAKGGRDDPLGDLLILHRS